MRCQLRKRAILDLGDGRDSERRAGRVTFEIARFGIGDSGSLPAPRRHREPRRLETSVEFRVGRGSRGRGSRRSRRPVPQLLAPLRLEARMAPPAAWRRRCQLDATLQLFARQEVRRRCPSRKSGNLAVENVRLSFLVPDCPVADCWRSPWPRLKGTLVVDACSGGSSLGFRGSVAVFAMMGPRSTSAAWRVVRTLRGSALSRGTGK